MSQDTLTDESPTHPDDELLVAYLDGELDRESRTEVEDRLVADADLRKRLSRLQAGWEMLDAIAVPDTSASLVETTLELAIADLSQQTSGGTQKSRSWWVPICLVAVIGAAAAIGYAYSAYERHVALKNELRDLAIAEDLDAYSHGGNLELMRLLSANSDWLQLVSTARELSSTDQSTVPLYQVAIEQRPDAIEDMPIERRVQLQSRSERWGRFDEATQATIRQNAEATWSQSDHESLIKTMRAYAIWRDQISSELRDQIESSDDKVRRQAIAKAVEESKSELVKTSGSLLDDETIERIYFVLTQLLDERFRRDPSRMQRFREFRQGVSTAFAKWGAIRFTFASHDPFRDRSRMSNSNSRRDPSGMSEKELSAIRLILSDEALDTLALLSNGDGMLEQMALQIWVDEAIRRKSPFANDKTLTQRYQELDSSEREVLDLLPPDRMLKSLSGER
ncbi:hypothetical protein N9N28_17340 [Rubripirellula amarantea]|nr:hypothetical protein [Rubripirellula amarantea]